MRNKTSFLRKWMKRIKSDKKAIFVPIVVLIVYYYGKNIQGDIIGIYDANGTELVRYEYSAYGEVPVKSIPNL